MRRVFLLLGMMIYAFAIFAQEGTLVLIDTDKGKIKVKLYDDTPLHRDNFIKNVKDGVYEGVLFHRVIKQFMVQAGDLNSVNAPMDKP